MLIHDFPTDIYQELLSWLGYDDQVSFAMVNQMICGQLIKHVRVMCLLEQWGEKLVFEQRFRSYLTSEKLQSLIADPYHQLNLFLPSYLDLEAAGFNGISISCKSLSIGTDQFFTSFKHCIKRVQALSFYYDSPLTDSDLQLLADWMNNRNLGLKELAINNENIPNLSAISKLESLMISGSKIISPSGLNISAYSNLRCLKLYSLSIEDVSSLQFCHKIRDISCLNHNHKIVIDECKGITDYSNSFRYSNIIHITYFFTPETIQAFDFSKALEARTIYFCGGKSQKPLKLPQSLSLYSVRVKDFDGPFQLPPEHNIRELLLYRTMMKSLLNFDDIYSVKLYCLTVSSLTGLGSGNRVVEVNYCPFIKDFSPLRHCDKVTIRNCKGFQDVNQVRDVKELIFSPANVNKLPKDLEGVTSLIFIKVPKKLLSLKFPRTLKKLVFTSEINGLMSHLPALLARLPHHIGKIEVTENEKNLQPFIEKAEFPDFIIEFKKGVHFLRSLN